MVLSSQRTRLGPTHMASSKALHRGRHMRPWIVMVVAAVCVVGGYRFFVSAEAGPKLASAEPAQTAFSPASPSVTPRFATGSDIPAPTPKPAVAPSITFGQDPLDAPVATPNSSSAAAGTTLAAVTTPAGPTYAAPGSTPAPAVMPSSPSAPVMGMPTTVPSSSPNAEAYRQGMRQIEQGQAVQGRETLSRLLFAANPPLDTRDAQTVRDTLNSVNKDLVFSSKFVPGDPIAELYVVQPGDVLARLAPKYQITYQLLLRINKVDPHRMFVGQKIKMIRGPIHAIVHKHDFRIDLFAYNPAGQSVFVASFPVGLGKEDSTPIGSWRIKPGGKLVDPGWTDPNSHRYYPPDDPANPIGEHWLALEGTDDRTRDKTGFGLHGTIDPTSIGKQMSLGCVRMLPDDIELVWELLVDGQSTVEIRP